MAVFIHCPHCDHPAVLPALLPGLRYRCRQCLEAFILRQTRAPRRSSQNVVQKPPPARKRSA